MLRYFFSITVALGAIAMVACGSDDAETQPNQTVPKFGDTVCASCVEERCADAISVCQTDPGCTTYLGCLLDCPVDENDQVDPACDAACSPHSSSEATLTESKLIACRLYGEGAKCTECAESAFPLRGGIPQSCEPRPEPAPTACRQCYWDKCCDTWDACYASGVNPECDALGTCIVGCNGAYDCTTGCIDAHPTAVDTLFAQTSCAAEFCAFDTPNCDPSERDACGKCWFETCGESWAAFISQPDGLLLQLCIGECEGVVNPQACIGACFDDHPVAAPAGFLWAECQLQNCETLC